MPLHPRWADLLARLLMSALFFVSGFGKLAAVGATQAYMKAFGVPPILLWPAAAFEIISGLLLVVGYKLQPLALLLAGWSVVTALIFHTHFADQMQMVNFLKNLAMAGGFIVLAKAGAPGLGIDGLSSPRVGSQAGLGDSAASRRVN